MYVIRAMGIEDVEKVARMVALDHDRNLEKGCRIAKEHTLCHLKIVPQHCYVLEDGEGSIVGAMILHPREEIFEIEDFHIKDVQRNKEALKILKGKLMEYLENLGTEVLCCPYVLKRLMQET